MEQKPSVNFLAVAGVIVNALVAYLASRGEYPQGLVITMIAFAIAGAIGVMIAAASRVKFGAMMIVLSSALFLPVGLIAVVGARRMLDGVAARTFETRRAIS